MPCSRQDRAPESISCKRADSLSAAGTSSSVTNLETVSVYKEASILSDRPTVELRRVVSALAMSVHCKNVIITTCLHKKKNIVKIIAGKNVY